MFNFLTNNRLKYWKERKIDWKQSYLYGVDPVSQQPMWNHPHREIIVQFLKSFPWVSLWEVGCGAGANLVKIIREIPGRQLGGSDVNEDAIKVARETFVGGRFHVESVEDLMLSDKSADVFLSDATLIYIDPFKIKKAVHEIVRSARNKIIFCEFHSTNFLERWWLRLTTGYNAYNYRKLLEDEGCYDIRIIKIPEAYWQGFPWNKWGYIITANVLQK